MVPHQWSTHRGHEARIPIYICVSQLELEIPAETRGRERKRKEKTLKHYNTALIYIVCFIYYIYCFKKWSQHFRV